MLCTVRSLEEVNPQNSFVNELYLSKISKASKSIKALRNTY